MSKQKPIRLKKRGREAYFGEVRNITRNTRPWTAPIGLWSYDEASKRMPWAPAYESDRPGDVVLRRMTRSAGGYLTRPVEGLDWNDRETELVRQKVDFLCHDLPVEDFYYVMR